MYRIFETSSALADPWLILRRFKQLCHQNLTSYWPGRMFCCSALPWSDRWRGRPRLFLCSNCMGIFSCSKSPNQFPCRRLMLQGTGRAGHGQIVRLVGLCFPSSVILFFSWLRRRWMSIEVFPFPGPLTTFQKAFRLRPTEYFLTLEVRPARPRLGVGDERWYIIPRSLCCCSSAVFLLIHCSIHFTPYTSRTKRHKSDWAQQPIGQFLRSFTCVENFRGMDVKRRASSSASSPMVTISFATISLQQTFPLMRSHPHCLCSSVQFDHSLARLAFLCWQRQPFFAVPRFALVL